MVGQIAASGVKAVSVSLDGASPATHDGIPGIGGHFNATVSAMRDLVASGVTVRINTTVTRANALELADVARLVAETGCHIREVRRDVPARITEQVAPGEVFIAFHFAEVRSNRLTSLHADEVTGCPEYKVIAVAVNRPR
jgi:MoaA/NifB/PqqE/SkfB family radical SAM enzyme